MPAVGDLVANLTMNSRGFSAGLGQARAQLGLFGSSVRGTLGSIAAGLSAYMGARSLLGGVSFGLQLAADAETAEAAFTTLTGSATKAKTLLNELKEYSKGSFFTFPNATEAAKQMLGLGIQVQDILPTMKMLGDLALGDQDKFNRLALALGQVKGYGHLRAQEKNQFTEAGVPIMELLEKQTGRNSNQLSKDMEAGAISIHDVIKALQSATSEGGRFFLSTERHADTLAGRFANLKEEIHDQLRNLGTQLAQTFDLKGMLTRATETLRTFPVIFSNLGLVLKVGVLEWGAYLAELNPYVTSAAEFFIANYYAAFSAVSKGFTNVFESIKGGFLETIRLIDAVSQAAAAASQNFAAGVGDAAQEAMGFKVKKRETPLEAAMKAFNAAQPANKDIKVEGGDLVGNFFKARKEITDRWEKDGGMANTLKMERDKAKADLEAAIRAGQPGKKKGLGGFVGASFDQMAAEEEAAKKKAVKSDNEASLKGSQNAARIMLSGFNNPVVKEQQQTNKLLQKHLDLLEKNPAPPGTVSTWIRVGEV